MEEIATTLTQRMPCLLDVLVGVCVQYLCSVMPRLGGKEAGLPDLLSTSIGCVNDDELHANLHIRLMAGEVLDLITKVRIFSHDFGIIII